MFASLIPGLLPLVGDVLDRFFPDKEKAEQAKQEVTEESWTAPTTATTIPAQKVEKEKEKWVGPKVINNGIPPEEEESEYYTNYKDEGVKPYPDEDFKPETDPDMMMTEEEFNNMALNKGKLVPNTYSDVINYPPKPSPKVKPVMPSMKLRPSNNYKTSYDSLLEQIETKKIIYVNPEPPNATAEDMYPTTIGEVPKVKTFEAPPVEELVWDAPDVVQMAVNENIKKEKPVEIKVESVPKEEMVELKTTYKGTAAQNNILYALREDWRPLYQKDNADKTLTGARYKLDSNRKKIPIPNTNPVEYQEYKRVRAGLSKPIRQAWWDTYIEEQNSTGVTKATKNTLYSSTPIPTDLMRTQRSVYWYEQEWNPKYPLPAYTLPETDN